MRRKDVVVLGTSVKERFVVSESSGYPIHGTTRQTSVHSPAVTEVMVLDRGYCYRVVWSSLTSIEERSGRFFTNSKKGGPKSWRTKTWQASARKWPLAKRRAYAADLAARLNAELA
jgi:hypothetical protein